jgi:multicomponent Na+:H+ antiporter subunit D
MITYALLILFVAAFLVLVLKRDIIAISAILLSFLFLVLISFDPKIIVVSFGGWNPPFGIVWVVDKFSLFLGLLITGISSLVAIFSVRYIKERKHRYYTLLCLLTIGLLGVSLTGDIFNFYVFFEILSISSYALVAFFLDRNAIEGALKYLIMGSLSTTFILLGIAMIYGLTGTLNFADIALKVDKTFAFLIPLGLMIAGFGLKAAIVPFHAWKPDAIEGTPAPIGAIFTSISTSVGVYAILRILFVFDLIRLNWLLIGFGLLSMIIGASLAFVQVNVKRLLAYSGISQIGYVVMAIGLGTSLGLTSGLYHLLNNALIKALLFLSIGSVIYVTGKENLNEMGVKNTPLMLMVGLGILAVSGIPPLNGFVSKWVIYLASWEINPILTVVAVVISAFTLAYYLKVFSSIFLTSERTEISIQKTMLIPIIILTILCIVIGVFPQLGFFMVDQAKNALLNQSQYINAVLR